MVDSRDSSRAVRTLARLARLLEHSCDDLTLPQYRLLATVDEGSERASLLAGRLALAKPSVSAMVDALCERGLLARTTVADDRRAIRLRLTAAGRRALQRAERAMNERLAAVLDRCSDIEAVEGALDELGDALHEVVAARLAAREPV